MKALRAALANVPAEQRPMVVLSHPTFVTGVLRVAQEKVDNNMLDASKIDDVLSEVALRILAMKDAIDPDRIGFLIVTFTHQTICKLGRVDRHRRLEKSGQR